MGASGKVEYPITPHRRRSSACGSARPGGSLLQLWISVRGDLLADQEQARDERTDMRAE